MKLRFRKIDLVPTGWISHSYPVCVQWINQTNPDQFGPNSTKMSQLSFWLLHQSFYGIFSKIDLH